VAQLKIRLRTRRSLGATRQALNCSPRMDASTRAMQEQARRAIDTGLTKYGNRGATTRSMHKDGRKLYVDLSFGLVRDDSGTITGALAIGRDCTAHHVLAARDGAGGR
jgi:PAS domain S-box-containing protein